MLHIDIPATNLADVMATDAPATRIFKLHPVMLTLLFGGVGAIFYITATLHGSEGHVALPGLEVLNVMAEAGTPSAERSGVGLPRFYPFLLHWLYVAGLRNEAMWEAAFVLNLVSFILFALFTYNAARRLHPQAAVGVLLLLGLNGYVAASAMNLQGTALFLAVLAGLATALLNEHPWSATVLLALAAWCRPEGAFIALALLIGALALKRRHVFGAWRWLVCGGIGLAAAVFVEAASWLYVWHHIRTSFFAPGMWLRGAIRFGSLVQQSFFGLSHDWRALVLPPVFGGVLALLGMGSAEWKLGRPKQLIAGFAFGAAASIVVGCFSSASDHLDSILPWTMALWIASAALGARHLADLAPRLRYLYPSLLAAPLIYEVASFPLFVRSYAAQCAATQATVAFLREQHGTLPPDASLGIVSHPGVRLLFPGRTVKSAVPPRAELFRSLRHPALAIEIYKHHPDMRFTYWLLRGQETNHPVARFTTGECVAHQTGGGNDTAGAEWGVYRADWAALVPPEEPASPTAREAVTGWRLVSRLDVGYPPDEDRHGYRVLPRLTDTLFDPVLIVNQVGSRTLFDAGDLVLGGVSFSFPVIPRRPMRMVIRTATRVTTTVQQADGEYRGQVFRFHSPLRLLPVVNGRALPAPEQVMLNDAPDTVSEIIVNIPGEYLDEDRLNMKLYGDHVALAYWFYQ